jgi:formylglycine-generating enzyme required for sulfatase activity
MRLVPAGSFNNGSADITLSAFLMSTTEITQAQYQAVIGSNPSFFTGDISRPVERVSWYDTIVFCNKLSLREGLSPVYSLFGSSDPAVWGPPPNDQMTNWDTSPPSLPDPSWDPVTMNIDAKGYRLPTSAEWEYAARGGAPVDSFTYSGSNTIDDVAWYSGNAGDTTHPVGGLAPNKLGLYDMSGNVGEWVWDWSGDENEIVSGILIDPIGTAQGGLRRFRGGCYFDEEERLAISAFIRSMPDNRFYNLGFRVVRRP